MIRVGYLPYLNVAPFYWTSNTWEVELIPSVPSKFGLLASQGQVDAGIMSLQDLFLQEAEFEPLGLYGICAPEKAQSVMLFSNRAMAQLEDQVIGVTEETSTSVKLLELLLKKKYHLQPKAYVNNTQQGTAWLFIGDRALREKQVNTMPYAYDLGSEWRQWQNLPFVFARWVVRRSLPCNQKEFLLNLIEDSFIKAMANLQAVAESRVNTSVLTVDEICHYLGNFNYIISDQEEAGLLKFRALLEKL